MRRETKCALVLAATVLLAHPAAAQTEINACAANAGGRLRVLAAGASCKRAEHAVSWAITGDAGPKGDPGDAGPPGEAGPPACRAIGLLTLPGIVGDGPGGAMVVYGYAIDVKRNSDPAGAPISVSDLTVTKALDKASVPLFQAAVGGTPFATATLSIYTAAPPTVAQQYSLTTVLISSLSQGAPQHCSTELPLEDVSLSYDSVIVSVPP